MAGKVKLKGSIGYKNMAPQTIHIPTGQNGEMREMRTFRMWAEDYTKASQVDPTTGKKRPQREVIQVVLPNDDRGKKLLAALSPGRRITVEGRLTHRPAVREDKKTGKLIAYANPMCYLDTMEFLDQEPVRMAEQTLDLLVEKGVVKQEDRDNWVGVVKTHMADLKKPVAVAEPEEGPLSSDDDGLFPTEE